MKSKKQTQQKNHVFRVVLLLLPILLFSALITVGSITLYNVYIRNNPYYRVLVRSPMPTDATSVKTDGNEQSESMDEVKPPMASGEPTPVEEGSVFNSGFPVIYYGEQWATLTVEGWYHTDIPVYNGDSDTYLNIGAGKWTGSPFCGQNGRVVISGHVLTDFYEMQDTHVGALVTMDTVYGKYVYRVIDEIIFDPTDIDVALDHGEGDQLFIYTCYPREAGLSERVQRRGLLCELVEGHEYEAYQ